MTVVSVVGPLTCTQKHVASHLCPPPSANQGAIKIHAFEADITRNYALGHYVFQCSKAHVFTGMEYTWCHVMFRCRFLALWPAAGRVIMFIPVDSVSMYIAFLSFIYENKWFACSDADVVTVSVYVCEKKYYNWVNFCLSHARPQASQSRGCKLYFLLSSDAHTSVSCAEKRHTSSSISSKYY